MRTLLCLVTLFIVGCKPLDDESISVSRTSDFANNTFQTEIRLLDSFQQPATTFAVDEEIQIEYRITNKTTTDETITFSSGQRISAIIMENDNLKLNLDAVFGYPQVIGDVTISANETESLILTFRADLLGSGNFKLIAAASLADVDQAFLSNNGDNQFVDSVEFVIQQ